MAKLESLKVKELIVACPNCYYQLRTVTEDKGIKLLTVYEALGACESFNNPLEKNKCVSVTVHDSCPDRFEGIFAGQARQALLKKGFPIIEMERNRNLPFVAEVAGKTPTFNRLADKWSNPD
jgi:Fe-S oxidoreductase